MLPAGSDIPEVSVAGAMMDGRSHGDEVKGLTGDGLRQGTEGAGAYDPGAARIA